jgi:MoaA/NifB/PqqE/SkfB family radical SAM enzyme
MAGTHGWAEIDTERKREIIEAIASGTATRGPVHAELDVTDRCNVACYFCNQQDVRTKQQVPLEHITRLLDEMTAEGLRSIRLAGGGDPLFHKEIVQILDAAGERGLVVDNITTNGLGLTPEVATRLVRDKCREVLFSLNAVDAGDYARMMQTSPATFDKIVGNIRHLITLRGTGSHPFVVVQFLFDRQNYRELLRMYELGRALGADRIAIAPVLEIPLERIDPAILFRHDEGETLRPFLEKILIADRDVGKLHICFAYQEWNAMADEIRVQLAAPPLNPFPTAPSFQDKNGACFFGWYTVAVRGNGDMYPCCMLMNPEYKPLGNALEGSFKDHWLGPRFARLRHEMREVLLTSGRMFFGPKRFQALQTQCVEYHQCGLKNMYFRGDEAFYKELGQALEKARKKEIRWFGAPKQIARAAEILWFRIYHGLRVRRILFQQRLARKLAASSE